MKEEKMTNFNDLPAYDIREVLKAIEDEKIKLAEASGSAVAAELKMRFLAQISEEVRQELPKVAANLNKKYKNYVDCKLDILDDAIDNVFGKDLDATLRAELADFRGKRNKLLHGDFVGLMKALDMEPGSREVVGFSNGQLERKLVEELNISEAIKSIKRQFGLDKIRKQADSVNSILDSIIYKIVANKEKHV